MTVLPILNLQDVEINRCQYISWNNNLVPCSVCIPHLAFPSVSTYLDCKAFHLVLKDNSQMALVVGTCCTELMDEHDRRSFLILQSNFHGEASFMEGVQPPCGFIKNIWRIKGVKKKTTVTYSLPNSCWCFSDSTGKVGALIWWKTQQCNACHYWKTWQIIGLDI